MIPEDDITQKQQTGLYLEYVSILSNLGNFKPLVTSKFIPRCEVKKFFKQLLSWPRLIRVLLRSLYLLLTLTMNSHLIIFFSTHQ
nr:BFH_HP1_G0048510.mRNA.1.CDS.1 [Saccharomyces cerevisiae]